jgi:hypothetical protein
MYVLPQIRVPSPLNRNVEVPPSLKDLCTHRNQSHKPDKDRHNPTSYSSSSESDKPKRRLSASTAQLIRRGLSYLVDKAPGYTAADGCKPPETRKPALQDLLRNTNGRKKKSRGSINLRQLNKMRHYYNIKQNGAKGKASFRNTHLDQRGDRPP